MDLVNPVVVAPVSPCSTRVRVQGQLPGARVRVTAHALPSRVVVDQVASDVDEWLSISAGQQLLAGDLLTAMQTLGGETSVDLEGAQGVEVMALPTQADLLSLFVTEPLNECGTCLFIAGAYPGARVELTRNNGPSISAQTQSHVVKFVLPNGVGLASNDVLIARQSACGVTGSDVPVAAPLARNREARPLSRPLVATPLYPCQRALAVSETEPGATLVVEVNGSKHEACFAASKGTCWLSNGLRTGDVVHAWYEFQHCNLRSARFEVRVEEGIPPPPMIVGPICRGDRYIAILGLVPGAVIELADDGVTFCRGAATEGAVIGVPPLQTMSSVTVRQSLCAGAPGTWSDWSDAVDIETLGPQPKPVFASPLVHGGVCVRVTTDPLEPDFRKQPPLPRGTLISIVSRGRGVLGEAHTNGDAFVDVDLWFSLRAGEDVFVRTRRCGRNKSWLPAMTVRGAADLRSPSIENACDCGGSLLINALVPGAQVELYRSPGGPSLIGFGRTGGEFASIDVQPLHAGDRVHARQRIGVQRSAPSVEKVAPNRPDWHYHEDSAVRLCQLTNDTDPTGRPRPVPTTALGITGTDLGIPVEHGGRLHLFFGDCREAPNVSTDADPIAWASVHDVDKLEATGPDLNWITDSSGKFRRLAIAGIGPLGNFEVPTGAFSYDGRIYVFVARQKVEVQRGNGSSDQAMTESYLIAASDAANIFTPVSSWQISSTTGGQWLELGADDTLIPRSFPGGRWMLHISPTVVRNEDWPGLPSNTGDGLLMFGSSLYRGVPLQNPFAQPTAAEVANGNVYLAWAPLTKTGSQLQASPLPNAADWSFLTGRDASEKPMWGSLRSGSTPMPLLSDSPSPRQLGEIGVAWYERLRRWVLMGSGFAETQLARQPWGPWSQMAHLCHPSIPGRDAGNLAQGGEWTRKKVIYAPYPIARWFRWDRSTRIATLYFNASVFDFPEQEQYQPHLFKSSIRCG